MYRIMTIALLLGLFGAVAAKPEKVAVQMDRQGSVAEQMRQVETALAAPDYAELSAEDRGQVQQALSRIRQHMGERQTVQELPPQLQAEVFNEQERINTLMARGHDDSRQICRYERTTGSNMPRSRCLTVAQRRKAQEDSRKALNDNQRFNNYKP